MISIDKHSPGYLTAIPITFCALLFFFTPLKGSSVLEADVLTVQPKKTVARGNVTLTSSGLTLKCESLEITVEEETQKIRAEDSVELTGPGWTITGKYLELDLVQKTADIFAQGEVTISNKSFSLRGAKISAAMNREPGKQSLKGTMVDGEGSGEGIEFGGGKIEIESRQGEMTRLKIEEKANIDLGNQTIITGNTISLQKGEASWDLRVRGDPHYRTSGGELSGKTITGKIKSGENGTPKLSNVQASEFSGELSLKTDFGERQFRVSGGKVEVKFARGENLTSLSLEDSKFSTCKGPRDIGSCAYSISADRTSLIDGEILLAESAGLKTFGVPIGWAPLYFISLKDVPIPRRNYFPRIGFSGPQGLFFQGALPIFVDVNHFGNVVLNYSSRHRGLGAGIDLYSGSGPLTGVAQLYGSYRILGTNYLGVETDLTGKINDWLKLDGEIEYKQGTFRGAHLNQSEWDIRLQPTNSNIDLETKVVREEFEERDEKTGEEIQHSVERLPEVRYGWKNSTQSLPLNYSLGGSLGYFRENKTTWSGVRTAARGLLSGGFSMESSPLDFISLYMTGKGEADYYYDFSDKSSGPRFWERLQPRITLNGNESLTVELTHQAKIGTSPFAFDGIDLRNRLSLDLTSSRQDIDQSLGFYYDFYPHPGFSDLNYKATFNSKHLDQSFEFTYEIESQVPELLTWKSTYSKNNLWINLSTGYSFENAAIAKSQLILGLNFAGNEFELGLEGKPHEVWLEKISAGVDLEFLETWSLDIEGKYDLTSGSFTSLSYTASNKIQDCLNVGISGDETGVWFDVQLAGI